MNMGVLVSDLHNGSLDEKVRDAAKVAANKQKLTESWQQWAEEPQTTAFLNLTVNRISELEQQLTNSTVHSDVALRAIVVEWATLQRTITLANTGEYK